MGAHAKRSASGNKRWMNCPGSIRISEGRPSSSSTAAMEGTAAHFLGEVCLTQGLDALDFLDKFIGLDANEDCHFEDDLPLSELFPAGAKYKAIFPIDANMTDAVQVYLDAVREELAMRPDAELLIEHRSSLNSLVGYDWDDEVGNPSNVLTPNGMYYGEGVVYNKDGTVSAGPMFGTNDAAVLQMFEHLTIFDYKHGQGVVVEVSEDDEDRRVTVISEDGLIDVPAKKGNSQLMQYALGVARDLGWPFDTLDLVIVQPRARHAEGGVRRYSTNKAELKQFEEELRLAAAVVEQPTAPLKAGAWCQFCPAAGIPCPELQSEVIRIAQVDFSDGEPQVEHIDEGTPDGKLETALAIVPLLDTYIKAIRTEAMRRLRESNTGTGFGYKLVRGKANRAWFGPPDSVVAALQQRGFSKEDLYEAPKLKGPAKIEALRPKALIEELKASGVKAPVKAIAAIVAELAHKPEGKIVVAPITDPREAVSPATAAASDFDVVEEE